MSVLSFRGSIGPVGGITIGQKDTDFTIRKNASGNLLFENNGNTRVTMTPAGALTFAGAATFSAAATFSSTATFSGEVYSSDNLILGGTTLSDDVLVGGLVFNAGTAATGATTDAVTMWCADVSGAGTASLNFYLESGAVSSDAGGEANVTHALLTTINGVQYNIPLIIVA